MTAAIGNTIVKWQTFDSSHIAKAAYYEGDLYVEFKSGKRYQYFDVPATVITDMHNADSIGKFLNEEIKDAYICEAFMQENETVK